MRVIRALAPVPFPGTTLLFTGAHTGDFSNSLQPQNITEVSDPAGGGGTVFQMVTANADITFPNTNSESNLASPRLFADGGEYWVSTKFLLPSSSYPTDFTTSGSPPAKWNQLMEVYGEPFAGTPNLTIAVGCFVSPYAQFIKWQRNGDYNFDIPWSIPMVYDTWVNVMLHFLFSATGWVELYINGSQINFFDPAAPAFYNPDSHARTTRLPTSTMDSSNNGAVNRMLLQNYHEHTLGTTTVFLGPVKVGLTRQSVGG